MLTITQLHQSSSNTSLTKSEVPNAAQVKIKAITVICDTPAGVLMGDVQAIIDRRAELDVRRGDNRSAT